MPHQIKKFSSWIFILGICAAIAFSILVLMPTRPADAAMRPVFPDPVQNVEESGKGRQTAVFAGGCFWGIEAVFRHTRGVLSATSGYAGGAAKAATYEQVSSGTTGHAESVQVVYDPQKITYGQLLKIFFEVAHDPTQLNYQGPDHGTQYRSAIFATNEQQARVARAYIDQLQDARIFDAPIVTRVEPLPAFYPAEGYHQNYLALHLNQPYIVRFDLPKLEQLRTKFPAQYQ